MSRASLPADQYDPSRRRYWNGAVVGERWQPLGWPTMTVIEPGDARLSKERIAEAHSEAIFLIDEQGKAYGFNGLFCTRVEEVPPLVNQIEQAFSAAEKRS